MVMVSDVALVVMFIPPPGIRVTVLVLLPAMTLLCPLTATVLKPRLLVLLAVNLTNLFVASKPTREALLDVSVAALCITDPATVSMLEEVFHVKLGLVIKPDVTVL